MSDPTAWATAMNNLGMAPLGMTGQPLLPGTRLTWAVPASPFRHGFGKSLFQLLGKFLPWTIPMNRQQGALAEISPDCTSRPSW